MQDIWKKLNLKDHKKVMVLNSPESFEESIRELQNVEVLRDLDTDEDIQFILSFVMSKAEIESIASKFLSKTKGDVIVWFSYPKGTSKKYTCDFNRDTGWDSVQEIGFGGVRQVAIDEDWSALRFRRKEYVKSRSK